MLKVRPLFELNYQMTIKNFGLFKAKIYFFGIVKGLALGYFLKLYSSTPLIQRFLSLPLNPNPGKIISSQLTAVTV